MRIEFEPQVWYMTRAACADRCHHIRVREVLWAFHRANERMVAEPHNRLDNFRTSVSRRAIRDSLEDEAASFARWAGRAAFHRDTMINAHFYLGGEQDYSDEE